MHTSDDDLSNSYLLLAINNSIPISSYW